MELVTALHPKVVEAVSATINEAKSRCMRVAVHSGLRSAAEQDRLYALGRSVVNPDGKSVAKPMGDIITKAQAYESFHCLGLAVDLVFKDINGNWTWNKTPEEWGELAAVGEIFGLSWGGHWTAWPDYPHFQMIGKVGTVQNAKKILFEKGVDALWGLV